MCYSSQIQTFSTTKHPLSISLPTNPGQFPGPWAWPRLPLFPAVRSAGRRAWIFRFPAILQKSPRTLKKSTRSPTSSLRTFCKKTLNFFQNQPAVQRPLSVLFAKKTPIFSEIQPAIQVFLGWLATRSVGLSGPNSAQSWFALSIILFQLRINLLKLWNCAANHRKS